MGSDDGMPWIVALMVFVLVVSTLVATFDKSDGEPGQVFFDLFENPSFSLAQSGQIDQEMILGLASRDYNAVRKEMGVSGEFCIYLEDSDGRIIPLREDIFGLGSNSIEINNRPCIWE